MKLHTAEELKAMRIEDIAKYFDKLHKTSVKKPLTNIIKEAIVV